MQTFCKVSSTLISIPVINSAKKADKEQELSCLKDEFEDAIFQTEQGLQSIVEDVFDEIKKTAKKTEQNPILIENKEVSPYEPVITILKRFRIKEIFLFHQEEESFENKKTTVLYLL